MRTPSRRWLLAGLGSTTATLALAGCIGNDDETITVGSSVTVDVSGLGSGDAVRVVWAGPDGTTQVLGSFTPT